jgi:hypothetical protein
MDGCGLQSAQLVCLELEQPEHHTRLYAEVIQIISARAMCWARPLAMVHDPHPAIAPELEYGSRDLDGTWIDLRDSADLLLPVVLFRAAYDTEVIPLLTQLHDTKPSTDRDRLHQQVRSFVQALCRTYPQAFPGASPHPSESKDQNRRWHSP